MPSDDAASDELLDKRMQQYQRAVEHRDFENASEVAYDIFALAEEWCAENPSPDFQLNVAAAGFEERSNWSAAESAYSQILSLPDLEPATEYKARSDLARLCHLLGRNSEALEHTRFATAAARRVDLSVLLVLALKGEASCLISCGEIAQASKVIAEAISAIDDDKMDDHFRASMLTLRAECAIHCDAVEEAERDLEVAFGLLEPLAGMKIAAGVHSSISQCWSVTASLRAKRDDGVGSIAAWQKAIVSSKHVASLTHCKSVYAKATLAENLKGLADAYSLCDRIDDASAATAERSAILDRIGLFNTDAE